MSGAGHGHDHGRGSPENKQLADAKAKEAFTQRIAAWRKTAERYESEPETQEGRKELSARAKAAEEKRDQSLAAYHHYELASAAIITGMMWLTLVAGGLGVAGIIFCLIGFFAPTSVHSF